MGLTISLRDVVESLALNYPIEAGKVNTLCPSCSPYHKTQKKTLNIDYANGVYRCNRCNDFAGGILDFWAYHRGVSGSSIEETRRLAKKDIDNFFNNGSKSNRKVPVAIKPRNQILSKKEKPPVPDEYVSKVYSAFLDLLPLSSEAHNDLLKRGLTEENIIEDGYKSLPITGLSTYCTKLLDMGLVLSGIPGFYKTEEGCWSFRKMGKGFLIPTKNVKGEIYGLQLRVFNPVKDGAKYLTVSTADSENHTFREGTAGKSHPHLKVGEKGYKKVILTEGPLKGNIISHFTGYTCICVLGVNNVKEVPEMISWLKTQGLEEVLIAYDMDKEGNIHVAKALRNLEIMLDKLRVPHRQLEWPYDKVEKKPKGLDDYLLQKRTENV